MKRNSDLRYYHYPHFGISLKYGSYLTLTFPPPSPAVVAIAVLVSGRDRSAGVALDPDETSLLVVLQQPSVAGPRVGGERAVGVPHVVLNQACGGVDDLKEAPRAVVGVGCVVSREAVRDD